MDFEKKQRRQSIKVIVSEAIMVVAVILLASILALLVSGYWLNSDFKVERQGMLQLYSAPTGANVEIDGSAESWLQRTNTSKVLPAGEHTVVLTKDGYDSWAKTINIKEGLLYRLHYPRLFLQNRTLEKTIDTNGDTFATISPDRNTLILANETTKWQVVDVDNDSVRSTALDISPYFSSVSVAESADVGVFSGSIISANWSKDNSRVLFKLKNGDRIEWTLLNVRSPKDSFNLTKEFATDFQDVAIIDDSASTLLALKDSNLHKIDVPAKQISTNLATKVYSFDHYENKILFIAEKEPSQYYLATMRTDGESLTEISELARPAQVVASKFYDTEYITLLDQNQLTLYEPSEFTEVANFTLKFEPNTLKVGNHGEFIVASLNNQIATLDMEAMTVTEWSTDGATFGWLDNNMIYSVANGELFVYDFDGLNRRHLSNNVSEHFPVFITANKWLYYFQDGYLVREWLIAR